MIINASSIIFIYFASFFGSNAKSGIKLLILLSITFFSILLGILLFGLIIGKKNLFLNILYDKPSILTIFFHFTPITSFFFSFSCIIKEYPKKFYALDYRSYYYYHKLIRSFIFINDIAQGINFIFYFLLLVLMETGYLQEFLNWFKLKFFLNEQNYIFSQENLPDEFLTYNCVNNSLNLNQRENHSGKCQDINKKYYKCGELSFMNNYNENNTNILLFENNNQDNIKTEESKNQNSNEINTNNLNYPLIQDGSNDHIMQDENIILMNKEPLSANNLNFDIGNHYHDVNKEKYLLDTRNDFTARIEGLYKTFWFCCRKNVRAINNLNLGLEANEKFGLLGFNGSGKTTTFKAITNEILYDYGKISLFGFDTRKEFKDIRAKIGYCPQENPLFDYLKVREILEFYSKLKTCFFSIEEICKNLGLSKYLDTYCVNLSGGNKRKLIFAIAIMNRPTLLLLDEPSTGVDPDSRRFMWKNINELSNSGHRYNMILTTHSMEEAEILCDRVGWLKHGSFVCIDNSEKLKIKYSPGYKLQIKFDEQEINQNNDINNIGETFRTISGLIDGFNSYSNFIMNNPTLESHIRELINVIKILKLNTKSIRLIQIRKDLTFELILEIINERKHLLFSDILSLKNNNNNISEIIITLESLEKILTSFI